MFNKYAQYYELFNSNKPYKEEIEFIYDWAEKPRMILDIGCGPAHYWDFYPDKVAVVGIEKSRDMILRSKNRGIIFCGDIQKGEFFGRGYDLVTALFDVVNYLPSVEVFKKIPLKKGGFFIFDVWSKDKVTKDGFKETVKVFGAAKRTIKPIKWDNREVDLEITIEDKGLKFKEVHRMYLHSDKDIIKFCGNDFEIVETKETESWQKWYKLKRK